MTGFPVSLQTKGDFCIPNSLISNQESCPILESVCACVCGGYIRVCVGCLCVHVLGVLCVCSRTCTCVVGTGNQLQDGLCWWPYGQMPRGDSKGPATPARGWDTQKRVERVDSSSPKEEGRSQAKDSAKARSVTEAERTGRRGAGEESGEQALGSTASGAPLLPLPLPP